MRNPNKSDMNDHGSGEMEDPRHYRLGEMQQPLDVSTSAENREIALSLASQAQKSLCILTRDLEHAVYNSPDFAEALTRLAVLSRYTTIRILLHDSTAVVRRTHRLVDLSHRLSSSIHIHQPHEEHRNITQAFLVADETGYLRRVLSSRYEGTACFHAPAEARELAQLFDRIWEKSAPDPELRRLYL